MRSDFLSLKEKVSTQAVMITLLITMLLVGILGTQFSYPMRIQPLGIFQVAVFPNGINIFQNQASGPYYLLSPLNDYYVTTTNELFYCRK